MVGSILCLDTGYPEGEFFMASFSHSSKYRKIVRRLGNDSLRSKQFLIYPSSVTQII
jgi:hypothetical protein